MGTSNDSDEFKRDAVRQITMRGYPVREVSSRLRVSTYSCYKWLKLFANLCHARELISAWRNNYNHRRPHTSLDGLTPWEFHQRSVEDQILNRAN